MSESGNSIDIVIPDIGDSENVEIIEILVSAGDTVSVDDSLLTLESDKASMEVPATAAGVIESLSVAVGDTVNSGDVIGKMSTTAGVDDGDKSTTRDTASQAGPGNRAAAANDSTSSDTAPADTKVAGDQEPSSSAGKVKTGAGEALEQAPGMSAGTHAGNSVKSPGPAAATASVAASPAPSPTAHISDENMRKAHASPGVRRYAREHGADLSLIKGTGPKARIVKSDVMAFIKQAMEGMGSNYGSGAGRTAGGAGIPPIPEVDFSKFGEIERVELGRINKLSAANLHRAWLNLPMVTHHEVADVTEMEAFRKQLKAEAREDDPKVTGLTFHMKALVKALQAFPKLNSSLSADGEALYYKHYYHIGIAVDTPNGLVVPVFRDVDKKSINQLAEEMSDVSARARQKKLKPDEMQGASMTISSLGGIGGTAFTPIVNPPEVAILGITRATMQPVWNGSEFIPRLMCPLDLTYDHRVVDGADAARFMAYYVKQIGDIRRLTL
jgi:pyruvate dehydrogenase E2 component (dihydrolipoamide acetyltransferase)